MPPYPAPRTGSTAQTDRNLVRSPARLIAILEHALAVLDMPEVAFIHGHSVALFELVTQARGREPPAVGPHAGFDVEFGQFATVGAE